MRQESIMLFAYNPGILSIVRFICQLAFLQVGILATLLKNHIAHRILIFILPAQTKILFTFLSNEW
jgi:hypothetical protein